MHPDQKVDSPSRPTSPWLLPLAIVVGVTLLLIVLVSRPRTDPVGIHHPGVGGRIGKFSVQPLLNTEQRVSLDDLHGKVTLINCWGPWCGPCLMEMPELLKLEVRYRGRNDVQVLLVSYPHDRQETLDDLRDSSQATLKRFRADPPIYHDLDFALGKELAAAAQLNGFGFPTTVLLDGEGVIRGVWTGYDSRFVDDMGQAIEATLAKTAH